MPRHMRAAPGGIAPSGIGGGGRFAAAAAASGSGSGSVPGTGYQRPVDTHSSELFPTLATADKIVQEQEEQQKAWKAAIAPRKKRSTAPAWGAKAPIAKKESPVPAAAAAPAAAPAPAPAPVGAAPAPASVSAAGAGLKKKPKKKKKKDISTFKAGG